jgi:hypothetical protein
MSVRKPVVVIDLLYYIYMKRFLFFVIVFAGFLFFNPQDAHADCVLGQASWNVSGARVGDTVTMKLTGSGCGGLRATFNIRANNEALNTRTANFNSAGTQVTADYIFNPGDAPEGTNTQVYFIASVSGLPGKISPTIGLIGGNCQLSNPRWTTGSVNIGQRMTMSIQGRGCAGYDLSFEVYDDDSVNDDFIKLVPGTFPSSGDRLNVDTAITTSDFQQAGGADGEDYTSGTVGERELEIYFIAKAGNSQSPRSGISIVGSDVLPDDVTLPTATPASGSRALDYNFEIDNPLGGASTLMELIEKISQWIFNLAIPVAVIFIIYGGLQFLFAGANPDLANKGKATLKYAVIGLAIVLIGHGFVTLVQSIIELGDSAPTTTTPQ